MKKILGLMLALMLAAALVLPAAAEGTDAETDAAATETLPRRYLNPAEFFTAFNAYMTGMADSLAGQGAITEADAEVLKHSFVFTQVTATPLVDGSDGNALYIGNPDWSMGATFIYTDEITDPPQDAQIVNMSFGAGTPEVVILLARSYLKNMVSVDYADEETRQAITEWFGTANASDDFLALPDGYSLNITVTSEYLTYSVLPPDEMNPFAK